MKKQKEVRAVPRRNSCPLCGHKELLTEGPDQFCLSCSWDTCAEYVERGLMNNLDLAFREHFPKQVSGQTEARSVFAASVPTEIEPRSA